MLIELIWNLFNQNWSYLAQFVSGNGLWLFMFAAIVKFNNPDKKWVPATLAFILFIFAFGDVMQVLGWKPISLISPLFFYGIIILTTRIFIAGTRIEKHTFVLTTAMVLVSSGIANYLMN